MQPGHRFLHRCLRIPQLSKDSRKVIGDEPLKSTKELVLVQLSFTTHMCKIGEMRILFYYSSGQQPYCQLVKGIVWLPEAHATSPWCAVHVRSVSAVP